MHACVHYSYVLWEIKEYKWRRQHSSISREAGAYQAEGFRSRCSRKRKQQLLGWRLKDISVKKGSSRVEAGAERRWALSHRGPTPRKKCLVLAAFQKFHARALELLKMKEGFSKTFNDIQPNKSV